MDKDEKKNVHNRLVTTCLPSIVYYRKNHRRNNLFCSLKTSHTVNKKQLSSILILFLVLCLEQIFQYSVWFFIFYLIQYVIAILSNTSKHGNPRGRWVCQAQLISWKSPTRERRVDKVNKYVSNRIQMKAGIYSTSEQYSFRF